jgi:hypothetical protein
MPSGWIDSSLSGRHGFGLTMIEQWSRQMIKQFGRKKKALTQTVTAIMDILNPGIIIQEETQHP